MSITIEFELNRAWVYDENKSIIGETNFIVPAEWLVNTFNKLNSENKFVCKFANFEDFVDSYEPEIDGELIYQYAIKDDVLKENLGITMYSNDEKERGE